MLGPDDSRSRRLNKQAFNRRNMNIDERRAYDELMEKRAADAGRRNIVLGVLAAGAFGGYQLFRAEPAEASPIATSAILSGEVFTGMSGLLDDVQVEGSNCGGARTCVSDEQRMSEMKERQLREEEAAKKKYEEVLRVEEFKKERELGKQAAEEAMAAARAESAAARAATQARAEQAIRARMGEGSDGQAASAPKRSGDKAACFWCG